MNIAGAGPNPARGMAMIAAGVFFFACLDAATKHLAAQYGAPFVIAARYLICAIVLAIVLLPRIGRAVLAVQRPRLVLLRSATIAIASLFAAGAYARMPVAEATAVIHLSPFVVLLLSGLVLREQVPIPAWLSAFGGMAGLILVTRPENGLADAGIALALGAAGMSGCYILLTRLLSHSENTWAMLFHAHVLGAVLAGALVPFNLPADIPPLTDLAILLVSSLISLVGHFLITAAYREAVANQLAPLNYLQLLWAGLIGWIIFDHVPDLAATVGMTIIAASGAALPLWTRWHARA